MMKGFIELTNTSTGKNILLNINNIASVEVNDKGALVAFPVSFGKGMIAYIVSESYNEVLRLISESASYNEASETLRTNNSNAPESKPSRFCPHCGAEKN